jgi:hypothetical protein
VVVFIGEELAVALTSSTFAITLLCRHGRSSIYMTFIVGERNRNNSSAYTFLRFMVTRCDQDGRWWRGGADYQYPTLDPVRDCTAQHARQAIRSLACLRKFEMLVAWIKLRGTPNDIGDAMHYRAELRRPLGQGHTRFTKLVKLRHTRLRANTNSTGQDWCGRRRQAN